MVFRKIIDFGCESGRQEAEALFAIMQDFKSWIVFATRFANCWQNSWSSFAVVTNLRTGLRA